MSLLVAFHDRRRAVICSDDKRTYFDEKGVQHALPDRVPKFAVIGEMILGCVGRADLSGKIMTGTAQMVAAEELSPQLTQQLADVFPAVLKQVYGLRKMLATIPAHADKQDVLLLGYDHAQRRMRGFVFLSENDFRPIETTSAPNNLVVALGAFSDEYAVSELTKRMRGAKNRHANWIAASLRDTANEIHAKCKGIGPASYFAAIDANGIVPLANEFALPPEGVSPEVATTIAEAGRMYIGSIMTPRASAPDTSGNNDGGTGAQFGMTYKLHMQSIVMNGLGGSGLQGNGAVANLVNVTDGNPNTYGTLTVTGNGASNYAIVYVSGIPGISSFGGKYQSLKLKIRLRNPTNSLSPNGVLASFTLATTTTGPGGTFTTQIANVPPTTQALTELVYDLPADANPGQVGVLIGATSYGSQNSGSCVIDLYECSLEAVA